MMVHSSNCPHLPSVLNFHLPGAEHHFFHKLTQQANLFLDSLVLSKHDLETAYFIDEGSERRLRIKELEAQGKTSMILGGGSNGRTGIR